MKGPTPEELAEFVKEADFPDILKNYDEAVAEGQGVLAEDAHRWVRFLAEFKAGLIDAQRAELLGRWVPDHPPAELAHHASRAERVAVSLLVRHAFQAGVDAANERWAQVVKANTKAPGTPKAKPQRPNVSKAKAKAQRRARRKGR